MAADIFDASPKSLMLIPEGTERKNDTYVDVKSKYKFSQLAVGQCFTRPIADIKNESAFRVTVARAGKKYGRKFVCLKHPEYGVYEVARIG